MPPVHAHEWVAEQRRHTQDGRVCASTFEALKDRAFPSVGDESIRLHAMHAEFLATYDPPRGSPPTRTGGGRTEVHGEIGFGPPKTAAGVRTVRLPRSVSDELASHIASHGVGPTDRLFLGPDGGPLRPSNFRHRIWNPAVRKAGLEPLRPRDLRHTAVALWIAAAANPKRVAARAGHTSVAFTLDRYGHLFAEDDEQLTERLDGLIRQAPGGRTPAPTTLHAGA